MKSKSSKRHRNTKQVLVFIANRGKQRRETQVNKGENQVNKGENQVNKGENQVNKGEIQVPGDSAECGRNTRDNLFL